LFVLDVDKYVSSHTSPLGSRECIIVLTSPDPTATQYIPFHAIRLVIVSLVSVFVIAFHLIRSVDQAIDAVNASSVGAPSPPIIQIVPFHIIEYNTPVIGIFSAGICAHDTPSLEVATFDPVNVSYPTATHTTPFQKASLHAPPRKADLAMLAVLEPHVRPPSADIDVETVPDSPLSLPNNSVGC
jgi:hypothetical protein